MKVLRENVSFDEVQKIFNKEHHTSSTHNWTAERLKNANSVYHGKWSLVELSSREVRSKISLMYHHHRGDNEYGVGIELIPQHGATVTQATKNLLNSIGEYKKENKGCLETIKHHKNSSFDPIFLCREPLKGFEITEHEQMKAPLDNLIHIDGLHRLIAWSIDGRFNFPKKLSRKHVTAYLAG